MISDKVITHVSGIITCAIWFGAVYGFTHYDEIDSNIAIQIAIGIVVLTLIWQFWKPVLGILIFALCIGFIIAQPLITIIILLILILFAINKSTA